MHTRMMQWSRGLYLAGMVLALVVIVPLPWFPFQLTKVAAFALCLLGSAVLFVAGGGARELWRSHGFLGALTVALLPLSYALSLAFSRDPSVGITGYAFEVDTLAFASLAFATYLLGFALFRTLRTARLLLGVLAAALLAAAVFQAVALTLGTAALPLEVFADRATNLVGKWNDLGLLLALFMLFMLVRAELGEYYGRARAALLVAVALAAVLLAFVNFAVAWALLLAGAVVVGLVQFLSGRGTPMASAVVAAAALLSLVWGAAFNAQLTRVIPVSTLEVRPSLETTLQIMSAARGAEHARFVVGTGPNTFGAQWILHKPLEVNQTQFWNLDFNTGYTTVVTALGTVGLAGAVAWVVPSMLVLAGVLRAWRRRLLSQSDRAVAVSLALASLFLAGALLLYVPSANLVLLTMALSGAAFGFLYRQGQPATADGTIPRAAYAAALAIALVVVGIAAGGSVALARRLAAEALVGRGGALLSAGDSAGAAAYAARARAVEETGDTVRFALVAQSARLAALAQDTKTPAEEVRRQFTALVRDTVVASQRAQALNPQDYRPVFVTAQLLDFLAGLKVAGADAQATAAYETAMQKNPTSPQIPLLYAKFVATQGDAAGTTKWLKQSLTLKPNYTDAMLFAAQLAIADNDITSAVAAARSAVASAPGVPSLWFQYGLLLYSSGDIAGSIPALEQAVVLVPDYANARYFLGLAYWAQKRQAEAIGQFEALAQTNPDNAEVRSITANMRAGKDPFASSATTPPQKRDTAPVSQ